MASPLRKGGGGGQGSAGGCLASRGHPQLHWSARGCAGLGVCDEVGGARAHLEVPWAGRSRDTHSGQAVSPSQPPLLGPEGADSVHPSRRGRRLGGGGVGWWMGLPVHLCGRGGPPAGLPCGSQIPTYLSLGVRSLRDLDHHVTACSEGARACGGGGGGCWACFRSGPISVGGGGGSKRSAPLFPGPQEEPAHGLHPRFVVAEIWADRGKGREGAGGRGGGEGTQQFVHQQWPDKIFPIVKPIALGTSKRDERRALGYRGLGATTWVPTGAQVPVLSPNDHPRPSRGRQRVSEEVEFLKIFQWTHASLETAENV